MYAGFLLGGVGGALLSMLRIVHRKRFPFGPFMLVGAMVGLLVGDWLARSHHRLRATGRRPGCVKD